MSRGKVRLQVQERYLNDLAAIDEVRHVEEAPVRKLFKQHRKTDHECARRSEWDGV